MADIDGDSYYMMGTLRSLLSHTDQFFVQPTKNGYHVYTNVVLKFKQMELMLRTLGADPSWIRIGLKRGYWFLADKSPVMLPWPTERMALHYDPSKKKDA